MAEEVKHVVAGGRWKRVRSGGWETGDGTRFNPS